VLAAAGVGAGDVVASAVAGASFGLILLWALLIGVIFKYFLNEGMARYQLATGKTFMEGYSNKWKGFNYYFIVYLVIWSFVVGGALLSGIGLVTSAIFPFLSLKTAAIICALIVLAVVISGTYKTFEKIMKGLALVMFICFIISAVAVFPSVVEFLKGLLIPRIPLINNNYWESVFKLLALMGGVGGTVTIMAYGYWIKENKVTSQKDITSVRLDLIIGYFVTFIFGVSVMIIAAALIHPSGGIINGKEGIIEIGRTLAEVIGPFGFWAFIIGFWAAVFSSLMSFYQAIPYLFSDSMRLVQGKTGRAADRIVNTKSWYYRGYMLFNVFPPMLLLLLEKPILLIMSFSVLGAFFMPFLALMLLIIGNDSVLGELKNRIHHNVVLILVLVVMSIVSFWPLIDKFFL